MAKSNSLSRKQADLKQKMAEGKEKTLLEAMLEKTGQIVRKLTGNPNRISFWYSAFLITLIIALIGLAVSMFPGKSDPRHTMMFVWDFVFMLPTIIGVKLHSSSISTSLNEHVIGSIRSGQNLDDLEHWWNRFTDNKSAVLFSLAFTILSTLFATTLALLTTGKFPNAGLTLAIALIQALFGLSFYNEMVFLSLPLRMRRYKFKLYAADPASSTLIGHLSNMFMTTVYLSALLVTILTFIAIATGSLFPAVIFLLLIPLWGIITVVFAIVQYSLAKIISDAKNETLNGIHTQIESLRIDDTYANADSRQTYNWLLDYYDRVKTMRSSAMNIRSTLGFLNSLLLPLLAFVLANFDKIIDLIL